MSAGSRDISALSPEQRAELERRLLRNRKGGGRQPAIPLRAAGENVPLSQAQQRLWFLEQLQPGSAGYNINGAARLAGPLEEPALRAALAGVVARHESLRTTFGMADGEPVQRIGAAGGFEMGLVDLTGLNLADREGEAIRIVTGEAERPFDLARGPLFRATLVRLHGAEHLLAITMHHIVSDGWSLGVFVRELGALYAAHLERRPAPLPPLPVQYADYAAWQRRTDDRAAAEAHAAFWKARLAGPLPVLDLPTDRRRPAVLTHRGATLLFECPAPLLDGLKRLSVDTDGTLFTTLMAGYASLLARYARQEEVVVGFPVAGRGRAELEPLIGFFVNTLVLRTDLSGDPTFRQLLRRVRDASIDAFAHQDMAFDRLVEILQPSREMGRHPLFQVGFALQNAPMPALALPGVTVSAVVVPRTRARFDLHVAMWEDHGRLAGSIEYSTDLFDAETVRRFGEHFGRLLEAAVREPDARLSALAITSPAEVRRLSEWNATGREYPAGGTIHAEFESRAAETPDAVAVTCGAETLTYRALNARANRLAHHLAGLGVGPDVLVGVCLDRSIELVVALLGILKAGGAYVPLDANYPRERLAFMIDDTALRFVVTTGQLAVNLPPGDARQLILVDAEATGIAAAPATNPAGGAGTDHLAYVIYTSGSTGRPKGVEVPHRGVLRLVRGADYVRLDSRARFLLLAPISFDASTFEIWGALLNGARCAIFADPLPTTDSLKRIIAAEQVTVLWLTASLFNALVDDDPGALGPVEQLLIGGEALSVAHVRRAYAALPGVTIVNGYGPTESTTFACCYSIPRELPEAITSIPIGRPISNTRVYVLDPHLQLQPPGVPGELYIGGDGLARGYLRRPDLTAGRFVADPFGAAGGRLYRTGDLVRHLDDGRIEFLGRFDDQVKIRGFRIEPGEIESVLHEHDAVREVVVIARARESLGTTLVAYVVPAAASGAGTPGRITDALREFARARLPEYMIPVFVVLEALPLTPNGKVDRDRLPAPVLDRASGGEYVAPRNDVEEKIAMVWSAALNVERVGANDNFFDLGGHSLLLVKVHRQLRDVLPGDLAVVDLFQYPTVGALARHLTGDRQVTAAPAAAPAPRARAAVDQPIAIVGMAGRFPGAPSVAEFWSNLANGVESVSFFGDDELIAAGVSPDLLNRPDYVRARAVIERPEEFDAGFFGYNPREASLIDPQQRVFLECAWNALEDAGTDPERFDGAIGVYAGVGMNTYGMRILATPELAEAAAGIQFVVSSDKDFLATRVSYKLNLRGPSLNVQTACSTSLVAVHLASRALLDGDCDMALAGGVRIAVPQQTGYVFQDGSILSPDGHCRAFDSAAAGTVSGNGAAVVVLMRLADAQAAGHSIYAVIKGSAINNDGSLKVGYTAPGVAGQADVIRRAHARAGVEPRTIGYVEAHGTGTSLGDPVEIAALTQAFRTGTADTQFCAIGSLKSNVGHLDAAAGVAGLIKAALSLKHAALPPTLHFERPNAAIDFEPSPFVVNTRLREWPAGAGPRRAGVSSFGLGGTNAHAVLEEAPVAESVASSLTRDAPVLESVASALGRTPGTADAELNLAAPDADHLLVLSAKSPAALHAARLNLASHLEAHPNLSLADIAFTLQVGRRRFDHRLALACVDREGAVAALRSTPAGNPLAPPAGTPAVTFMFTGQGSQQVNMMRRLYDTEPVFRAHFDACARHAAEAGVDLHAAVYPAPEQTADAAGILAATAIAQPALFAVEYSLAQLWQSWGIVPAAMIGHSLGEYVAACVAGVLSLEEAIRLVVLRGRLMQALEPGAMLAVPLGEAELAPYLDGTTVAIAALNTVSSSVVSGTFEAIDRLEQVLAQHGFECQRLQTSHAFHSAMMDPALDAFRAALARVQFGRPGIPYVSNLTGDWITAALATTPDYWVRHLRGTVRFHDGLATVLQRPGCVLLEVGPGRTLTSLARRAARAAGADALASFTKDPAGEPASLLPALGRLWVIGAAVNWPAVHASQPRRRVPQLPTYPFERQRYWIEVPIAAAGRSPRRMPHDQWFYTPGWTTGRRPRAVTGESVRAGAWLVLADSSGVGDAIVQTLRSRNATVVRVTAGPAFVASPGAEYVARPDHPADYDTVLAAIREAAFDVTRVINCWPIDAASAGDPRAFYSSLFLVQSLVRHYPDTAMQFVLVTSEAHEVVGGERIDPGASMAIWPARVLPLEYPNLNAIAIDLGAVTAENSPADAESIIEEAVAGPGERVVAVRNRRRWVQVFQPLPVDAPASSSASIRAGGVYLVTGGTGGVGLELARYLAARAPVRIALLGRTAIPGPGARANWVAQHGDEDRVSRVIRQIERIESAGAEVLVVQGDAADETQMRVALAAILERFGALDGVFLATGADKTPRALEETTREQCEDQFRSRVQAAEVIDRVLGDRPLDFCVVHSSLSAVLGAAGFAAYTAAHLFVDAFALRRNRRGGAPWTVIDWDNWTTWKTAPAPARPAPVAVVRSGQDAGGVRLEPDLEQGTGYRMATSEAFEALDLVLAPGTAPHVVVSTMELAPRMAASARARVLASATTGTEHQRPALDTAYVAPTTQVEQILAGVWQELLGIDRVGVHDNFFALGGDSVVGIQVVARASAAGVRLTTRQAFEHQTIAELAAVAVRTVVRALPTQIVSGPVPLTPIQHWFFEQNLPDPDHFNQAVWLELDWLPAAEMLERAAAAVALHHDALRLRFARHANRWEQRTGDAPHSAISVFDLDGVPDVVQETAVLRESAALQRSLSLAAGPVFRLGLFNRGADRPVLLFVVAHHLIVDALSWRTLLDDLGLALQQVRSGQAIALPAATTPFQAWARALAAQAKSDVAVRELEFWTGQDWRRARGLPVDLPGGENTVGSTSRTVASLTGDETVALVTGAPERFDAQLNEILLAALYLTLRGWTEDDCLLVDVEGHGREAVVAGTDLSRTVGWFTTIFPVMIEARPGAKPDEIVARVRQQLRAVPDGGLGFGLLRYLSENGEVRRQLSALPQPDISFLYLGRMEQGAGGEASMRLARRPVVGNRSPLGRRRHAIELEAVVLAGRLQLTWIYSHGLHRADTIDRLSGTFMAAIRELMIAAPVAIAVPSGGRIAAEFPAARLDQHELDSLLSGFGRDGSDRTS